MNYFQATIAIGEKIIALIATGTAVFLPSLPAPSPPRILAGNSWSNSEKIRDLQKSLRDTFDRNREIYQLKSAEVKFPLQKVGRFISQVITSLGA